LEGRLHAESINMITVKIKAWRIDLDILFSSVYLIILHEYRRIHAGLCSFA
jgi:hypothetical protein